jgi:hypothetical protein
MCCIIVFWCFCMLYDDEVTTVDVDADVGDVPVCFIADADVDRDSDFKGVAVE